MSFTSLPLTRRLLPILLLALFFAPASVRASDEAEQAYVTSVARAVMQLSVSEGQESLRGKLSALLDQHADIRTIALFALGPYRKDLPPQLRERYFDLVQHYAAGVVAYYIRDFSGARFEVQSTAQNGRFVIVTSEIDYANGRVAPVLWRVLRTSAGPKVADVNVRGIWLSLQMRTTFSQVLERSRGDFDQLIAYLERS